MKDQSKPERYAMTGRPEMRMPGKPASGAAEPAAELPGWSKHQITFVLSICAAVIFTLALPALFDPPHVAAQFSSSRRTPSGAMVGNPNITIAAATATSAYQSTTGANAAHVQWVFGTVTGTYSGCTVQAKTSFDGANWLTLGSAAAVTVATGAVNAWDILQQGSTSTGVTVTAPSAAAAVGFGAYTEYTFACTSYGTTAPVTISAIYK